MIYQVVLKFGPRYITKTMNGTWDEIKNYYGSKAIKIMPKEESWQNGQK